MHEVTQHNEFVTVSADTRTEIPAGEKQAGFRYGTAG